MNGSSSLVYVNVAFPFIFVDPFWQIKGSLEVQQFISYWFMVWWKSKLFDQRAEQLWLLPNSQTPEGLLLSVKPAQTYPPSGIISVISVLGSVELYEAKWPPSLLCAWVLLARGFSSANPILSGKKIQWLLPFQRSPSLTSSSPMSQSAHPRAQTQP